MLGKLSGQESISFIMGYGRLFEKFAEKAGFKEVDMDGARWRKAIEARSSTWISSEI